MVIPHLRTGSSFVFGSIRLFASLTMLTVAGMPHSPATDSSKGLPRPHMLFISPHSSLRCDLLPQVRPHKKRRAAAALANEGGASGDGAAMGEDGQEDLALQLRSEVAKRGLDPVGAVGERGPAEFTSPRRLVEYVMRALRDRRDAADDAGVREAFRFTANHAGRQTLHGEPSSDERMDWTQTRILGGLPVGPTLTYGAFRQMIETLYPFLMDFTRYEIMDRSTLLSPSNESDDVMVFLVKVWGSRAAADEQTGRPGDGRDERSRTVAMRLVYNWARWCYLIYRVDVLG
mmetsp:Transcript_47087/g.117448  ORF Transcript_47087/g.117448 Transcript_47087/m.117448 type:complete len:289 (-) Transcript_47087:191-1057(-)